MPQALRIATTLALFALLLHCEPAPATAPGNATEVRELGPNAALIRNPVDAGTGEVDTINVARMTFSGATEFAFGEVDEGAVIEHEFPFTNSGRVPLLIRSARSTCGCTVPSYPQEPIAPGESGVIRVAFDTKNKQGRQRKPVTITANTYPATTVLYVAGTVTKQQ